MFSVESSFSLRYFIFGFSDVEKSEVVVGIYDKEKKEFFIDYNSKVSADVKKSYMTEGIFLPYVHIQGIGYESYTDIRNKGYVQDKGFFIDYFNYQNEEKRKDEMIHFKNGESFYALVGLSDGLRWNTGRLYESCKISLEYDDYFDDIFSVTFTPMENVKVVSYKDVLSVNSDKDEESVSNTEDEEEGMEKDEGSVFIPEVNSIGTEEGVKDQPQEEVSVGTDSPDSVEGLFEEVFMEDEGMGKDQGEESDTIKVEAIKSIVENDFGSLKEVDGSKSNNHAFEEVDKEAKQSDDEEFEFPEFDFSFED